MDLWWLLDAATTVGTDEASGDDMVGGYLSFPYMFLLKIPGNAYDCRCHSNHSSVFILFSNFVFSFLWGCVSSFSCLLVRSEVFITLFLGYLSILFMLSNIVNSDGVFVFHFFWSFWAKV
jgi:hypothetical protein